MPAEITHTNLQPTIDLTMGVSGRDLGHVADDVVEGRRPSSASRDGRRRRGCPTIPDTPTKRKLIKGSKIELSGEYSRMQDTFRSLGFGLILATLLIYFLMVALFKSYVTPLVILFAVPLGLVGVVPMLYLTGTAINVQSLLGVIFMVGIVVSNTVLLTDFAQNLRTQEGLTPDRGDPQGGVDPRAAGGDDGPGGLLRPDSRWPWPWSAAARRTRRWAARSSAACWPAWSPRCSWCPRSIRWWSRLATCEDHGPECTRRSRAGRRVGWDWRAERAPSPPSCKSRGQGDPLWSAAIHRRFPLSRSDLLFRVPQRFLSGRSRTVESAFGRCYVLKTVTVLLARPRQEPFAVYAREVD